jgi:hypothetical protein
MKYLTRRLILIIFVALIAVFLFGPLYHNGLRMHCPFCSSGSHVVQLINEASAIEIEKSGRSLYKNQDSIIILFDLARHSLSRAPPVYFTI